VEAEIAFGRVLRRLRKDRKRSREELAFGELGVGVLEEFVAEESDAAGPMVPGG
jgi:hypothetical protein